MAKAKSGKKNDKSTVLKPAASAKNENAGVAQAYIDGAPLDKVTYLEAKLILKPDRFTSVQSFRDFGAIVRKTAKKAGVGFVPDPDSERRPQVREIVFGDTPAFRL